MSFYLDVWLISPVTSLSFKPCIVLPRDLPTLWPIIDAANRPRPPGIVLVCRIDGSTDTSENVPDEDIQRERMYSVALVYLDVAGSAPQRIADTPSDRPWRQIMPCFLCLLGRQSLKLLSIFHPPRGLISSKMKSPIITKINNSIIFLLVDFR